MSRRGVLLLGVAAVTVGLVWAPVFVLAAGMQGGGSHGGPPHGGMTHAILELPKDLPAPTVAVRVEPDPKAGWNVRIETTNFRWAPEHASQAHVPGEGHAHLYVDGKKVARLYGAWFHLERLAPGTREVRVTLNANSHEELAVGGKVLAAVATVRVGRGKP